jgi:chromosome segregation ATPase
MALKRQITDLKENVKVKDEELLNLKRDMRNTKYSEFESENNILMNECVRLRAIIDQLFAQMNKTSANDDDPENPVPENGSPERKDHAKDDMIQNLLQANQQFQKVDQEKDHRIMELQEIVQELDEKFNKKSSALGEAKRNHTKVLKAKNKEIQQIKQTLDECRKDSPIGNKSFDTKNNVYKEAAAKAEKELTRVRNDLKKYKDEFQKAKSQISELKQSNDSQSEANQELQRQVTNYKNKFDLYKKKEENLQEEIYQLQNAQKGSKTSNRDSKSQF